MKLLFCFFLLPLVATAATVPVEKFDQSALENIIRRIPTSFIEAKEENGVIHKGYSFPNVGPLKIVCVSRFLGTSSVSQSRNCKVELEVGKSDGVSVAHKGDEYRVRLTNTSIVREFYKAITFSKQSNVVHSEEMVYGRAFDGTVRNLFRYRLYCTIKACELTFVSKAIY